MGSLLHNVASGLYPHFLWLFKDILPELRTHFTFHDHLLALVEDFKQSIRAAEARSVIFVGVHCRRTDYAHHYKVVSGGTLVDRTFFDAAFDVYRERYNDQENKVVFLAVSDDPKWMKVDFSIIFYSDVYCHHLQTNLGHHKDVMFGSDYSEGRVAQTDMVKCCL